MATETQERYSDWVGRREAAEDGIALSTARAAASLFDRHDLDLEAGMPLPSLWHWFYFLPAAPQERLSRDGHPERGAFMPPIPLPRRMFAGARARFHRPLQIDRPARRESEILKVALKSGRSGDLAFVTVAHWIVQDGELCIEEERDIVYKAAGQPVAAPPTVEPEPLPAGTLEREVSVDPRLLFRFSALTFNAHRIHYDRPYAMEVEGYPGLVVHEQDPLTPRGQRRGANAPFVRGLVHRRQVHVHHRPDPDPARPAPRAPPPAPQAQDHAAPARPARSPPRIPPPHESDHGSTSPHPSASADTAS